MNLSGRLLVLMLGAILIGEALIYFPSMATYRLTFLRARLLSAQIGATEANASANALIEDAGIRRVIIRGGESGDFAFGNDQGPVDETYDLRRATFIELIYDAGMTLFENEPRTILVIDNARVGSGSVEAVMDESRLRRSLRAYSWSILSVSLVLSVLVGLGAFVVLHLALVRPMRRLTQSMIGFSERPYDRGRTIVPSGRGDEIGSAERALAEMQERLRSVLASQSRLAGLGAAVAKISHDLRNILATAQLVGDRLRAIDDPMVQRLAPTLIQAIDRALSLCQRVLRYGTADEPPPQPRQTLLSPLVEEAGANFGLPADGSIEFINEIPEGLLVRADPEQLFRVLVNLGRNAVQAIEQKRGPGRNWIRVSADLVGDHAAIVIGDSGPGLPRQALDHLFEPFRGSNRAGGAGLGLAIAQELMAAQGGALALLSTGDSGTRFRLTLPGSFVPKAVA